MCPVLQRLRKRWLIELNLTMFFEMSTRNDRIDGWKAIGAHFGRDRTTAIRWAKQRGLPVHALPGGKTRTVFALRSELDAWHVARSSADPAPTAPISDRDAVPISPIFPGRSAPRPLVLAAGVILCAALISSLIGFRPIATPGSTPLALPDNPQLAQRYINARDAMARRDASNVTHALSEFDAISAAEPGFAPAKASLADSYLLAREFGAIDDTTAFPRAKVYAQAALALESQLATPRRALGMIAYWWEHDAAQADMEFRRALALDAADPLTHLWYANMLADNGDARAAAREFAAAKLLQPGLSALPIDEAWALWSDGQDMRAKAMLEAVIQQSPTLASAHDCLSMIALARGDLAGYARELAVRARLRGEPALVQYASAIGRALEREDRDKLALLMVARAETLQIGNSHQDQTLAAFFQSALGRRTDLLAILKAAEQRHDIWQGAGFRLHIALRWRGDIEILRLLDRLAPPRLD